VWQSKKERARDTSNPWRGTIVPLTFNPSLEAERDRVVETVEAYCHENQLRLLGLVFPSLTPSTAEPSVTERPEKDIPLTEISYETWMESLTQTIAYPPLITKSFLNTLKTTAGRVIFAGCSDASFGG
jgi:hypothetical protein